MFKHSAGSFLIHALIVTDVFLLLPQCPILLSSFSHFNSLVYLHMHLIHLLSVIQALFYVPHISNSVASVVGCRGNGWNKLYASNNA